MAKRSGAKPTVVRQAANMSTVRAKARVGSSAAAKTRLKATYSLKRKEQMILRAHQDSILKPDYSPSKVLLGGCRQR